MLIPITWLRDFVEITLPIDELAHLLTMAGLEVEEITFVGMPMTVKEDNYSEGIAHKPQTKISGIEWDPEKIVVAAVHEVLPHPNADRLVLCRLNDGLADHIVLTGAPNLYPYKNQGRLERPLMVPYARQGAQIFDGHQPGKVLTTLKPAKIRGVESYSMICSEKELGISDEHEGVIILDDDAPLGVPLVDYMGDAVLNIAITPNIARNANVLGVAREIAALTGESLRNPGYEVTSSGAPILGQVSIQITNPELNPRFVLGLIRDVEIKKSPYWIQRRLRLAGMRPIDSIVDATNYVMLEIGQPLHAFDYDVLVQRAGGKPPTIITRTAREGERLITLDGEEHVLKDFTVLVCDEQGALAMAGVMGGEESEVQRSTRNVLLEGAAWNYINIRRTIADQRMSSEAAYRFSRGVHPAVAERGVRRGLELMRQWSGGVIAEGLLDNYPSVYMDPKVRVNPADVERWLGIRLTSGQIAQILRSLEFSVEVDGDAVVAASPDHRLDIGTGITGMADLMEEIARIYGYEKIPETRMADELPPQFGNPRLEKIEFVRDVLVNLGLQEIVSYRFTSVERESRFSLESGSDNLYVKLSNPIASDRNVLRRSLLASVLEAVEKNARIRDRIAFFEIGPVFYGSANDDVPDELLRLAIAMTGVRSAGFWQGNSPDFFDFYDLKGILSELFAALHVRRWTVETAQHAAYHPGKCARILLEDEVLGIMGELHPLVVEKFEFPGSPVIACELDLDRILAGIADQIVIQSVPAYPPVLEDIAVILDDDVPAESVIEAIYQAGGDMLVGVQLFDVFHGEQVGAGKRSLAFSLAYQASDRTLTDEDAARIRARIVARLEKDFAARLRSDPTSLKG